jgi:hypothetical protein
MYRERFQQLKEANLEYSHAMEEMNQELGRMHTKTP